DERPLGGGKSLAEKAGRAGLGPLELPRGADERPLGGRDVARGPARRLEQLLAAGEERPLLGERCLLAFLRIERRELLHRVAQPILFGAGPCELGLGRASRRRRVLPAPPRLADRRELGGVPPEGVEQRTVARRVEEAALLELALDLDQRVADLLQERDADRLVVDEGAAPPVGPEDAAKHDRAFVGDALLVEKAPCRMPRRRRELRRHHG